MKNKIIVGVAAFAVLGTGMLAVNDHDNNPVAVEDKTEQYTQVLGASTEDMNALEEENNALCDFIVANITDQDKLDAFGKCEEQREALEPAVEPERNELEQPLL